jgi:hypothetical protein
MLRDVDRRAIGGTAGAIEMLLEMMLLVVSSAA